jgi:Carboxypeptidase regulatory-like domain
MARVTRIALGFALCAAAITAVPTSAMAGSIFGAVTAENGDTPIESVEVCPRREPYTVETDCTTTDGTGHYSLNALPEGSYKLNFSANRANLKYVSEFFDNKRYSWEADLVSVGGSGSVTVDAQLAEGGSIAGTVTDEGSGNPIAGISACAIDSEGFRNAAPNPTRRATTSSTVCAPASTRSNSKAATGSTT